MNETNSNVSLKAAVIDFDPKVTSTVNETDSSFSDLSCGRAEVKPELPSVKPVSGKSVFSDQEIPDSSAHEFEIPEYEFDDEIPDLQGDPFDDDSFDERMSPDAFMDEDFERELGWYEKELSIQEVIDSEFPDISRLGILQVGGSDHEGRKVIAFFACRLPSADLIDHERLLQYVTKTLEQYVTSDYTLVYFHWGLTTRNKPSFPWLSRAYQTFDRSFKKNLKCLLIVYPTRTVRVLWNLFSAFVSSKMRRKLHYVMNLRELETYLTVSQLNVPLRIRDYDSKFGLLGAPLSIDPAAASVIGDGDVDYPPYHLHQQFGVSLDYIRANNGDRKIPIVVEDTITYLRGHGLNEVGLFIKPTHIMALRDAQCMYNRGEPVDLCEMNDPHLAAHLLKSFLMDLKEPLLTFDLYEGILRACSQPPRQRVLSIRRLLTVHLPRENYEILQYIFKFLTEVLDHSSRNMVTAASLSVALASSLIRSRADSVMPSQGVQRLIVGFTQLCITHFENVFARS